MARLRFARSVVFWLKISKNAFSSIEIKTNIFQLKVFLVTRELKMPSTDKRVLWEGATVRSSA